MPHPIHGSYNTTEPDAQFTNYCIPVCPHATNNMFPSGIALETCNLFQILFHKYAVLLWFCLFATAISYIWTVYCSVGVMKRSRILVKMRVLRVACLLKCGRIHLLNPNYAFTWDREARQRERLAKASCNLIISKTAPAVRTQRSTNTASVISTNICSLDELFKSRSAVAYVECIGRMWKYITR